MPSLTCALKAVSLASDTAELDAFISLISMPAPELDRAE